MACVASWPLWPVALGSSQLGSGYLDQVTLCGVIVLQTDVARFAQIVAACRACDWGMPPPTLPSLHTVSNTCPSIAACMLRPRFAAHFIRIAPEIDLVRLQIGRIT